MMTPIRKLIFIAILFLSLFAFSSCAKNQTEQVLESLQAIEYAMRMNVDDPENLLVELDACIEKYEPVWEKSKHLFETRTPDEYKKEYDLQVTKLRATANNIIELDLEIQDRLQNRPDLLKAYEERVQKIGY